MDELGARGVKVPEGVVGIGGNGASFAPNGGAGAVGVGVVEEEASCVSGCCCRAAAAGGEGGGGGGGCAGGASSFGADVCMSAENARKER